MSAWNVHHASIRNINKQTIGVVALLGFKHVSFRTNSLIRSQQFEGQSGRTACADTGGVDREEESWAASILFYCQLLESFLFKLAFVSPSSCLLLWLWKSVVAPGLLLVLRTVFVLFFNNFTCEALAMWNVLYQMSITSFFICYTTITEQYWALKLWCTLNMKWDMSSRTVCIQVVEGFIFNDRDRSTTTNYSYMVF